MKTPPPLLALALLASASLVRADATSHQRDPSFATGFVTPHELSFTLTDLGLVSIDGMNRNVWPPRDKSGAPVEGTTLKTLTFRRSDAALQPIDLDDVDVPEGRYIGLSMMFKDMTARIDGGTYVGNGPDTTQGPGTPQPIGLPEGTKLCSNGVDGAGAEISSAAVDGALTAVSPQEWTGACSPAARTLTNVWPGGGASSWFQKVHCFSPDGSICQPGDEVISADTPTPGITLLMDLFHALQVVTYRDPADASRFLGTVTFAAAYPMPLMGRPGAAIHLEGRDQGAVADASLIFSGEGTIQAIQLNSKASRQHFLNARNGFAMVTVTKGPEGFVMPPNGMAFVAELSLDGAGRVRFPLTAESHSRGLMTLEGFHAPVGSPVSIACEDVNALAGFEWEPQSGGLNRCTGMAADPAGDYLGYVVRRVVDPPVGGDTVLSHGGCEGVGDGCAYDAEKGVTTFGTEADGYN